jgi:hypothetical protein
MGVCRCGDSVFRHYDENAGGGCTACPCPEYRPLELTDAATLARADNDDDHQPRSII